MPRKKLFYVPGLISLLGLPVLLFFLGSENHDYQTVLMMNFPADRPRSDGGLSFNKVDFLHMVKDRKLISVDIDDCPLDDHSQYEFDRKLAFIPRELERLQFTNDTNAVFRLRFGRITPTVSSSGLLIWPGYMGFIATRLSMTIFIFFLILLPRD
jgi:hypothetical protein